MRNGYFSDRELKWIPRDQYLVVVVPKRNVGLARKQLIETKLPYGAMIVTPDTNPIRVRGIEISEWAFWYCNDDDVALALSTGLVSMLNSRVRL